jgi:hypothetical protein
MSKKDKQQTAEPPQKAKMSLDGSYPGLNMLSWSIGYLEQFLAIISEPLLIVCAAIAVIDFMTGGRILALPLLMYTWAASLAIAVTASFIVTWRRAIRAFTLNYYGVSISLALLGSMLGVVDWAAIDVQSLQQTLGVPFVEALAQLNLNIIVITHIRSAVAIAMAVVVAVSNHNAVTTAQAPKRRFVFIEQALNKLAPIVSSEETLLAHRLITEASEQVRKQGEEQHSPRLHIVEAKAAIPSLEKVKQALTVEPTCSDRRLGKLTNLAPATAKKYRLVLEQERSQAMHEAVNRQS